MATRQQLEEQFETHPGTDIIRSPGKFEGSCLYVPYFWDIALDGGADEEYYEDDTLVSVFVITSEDVEQFPELTERHAVKLYEDDQGFVNEI